MVSKNTEEKQRREIILRKASFYYTMNLKCHIRLRPVGFLNGTFVSSFIEEGAYFMFDEFRRPGPPKRVFIDEIFDIKDYEEVL